MADLYLNQSRPVFGANGGIEAGAKVYFYLTGTTTKTPIYSDAALTTELPNPVVANAAGVFPAIYLDTDNVTYRAYLTDASDVLLSNVDPYYPGDLNDAIEAQVTAATDSATAAAALALALAGPIVADNAEGLAATSEGGFFGVNQGDGTADIYRHDAGPVATAMGRSIIIDPQASGAAALIGSDGGGSVQSKLDDLETSTEEAALFLSGSGQTSPSRRVSNIVPAERVLTPPTGFGWTPPVLPVKRGGRWVGNISSRSLVPAVVGATYYVDPSLGSDSNAGTDAAPFQRVMKALQQTDCGRIRLAPSMMASSDQGAWSTQVPLTTSPHIIIEPWTIRAGRPQVNSFWQHYEDSWTVDGTYGRVYSAARSNVIEVWGVDDFGEPFLYVNAVSVASAQNRPGSWYSDGTTLWVHSHKGGKPDRSVRVSIINYAAYWNSNKSLYVRGIDFLGGGEGSFVAPNSSADFIFEDCRFGMTKANGIAIYTSGTVITERCRSMYTGLDGFNWHASATHGAGEFLEIESFARMNGHRQASNQCSTAHDGVPVARYGCDYGNAELQTIADVNVGTRAWNVGVSAFMGRGVSQTVATVSDTDAWFYDCALQGSIQSELTGEVYLHNSTPQLFGGAGSFAAYEQV